MFNKQQQQQKTLGIEGSFLNLEENTKSYNYIFHGEKLEAFLQRLERKQEFPLSSLPFNVIPEVLVNAVIQEKEIKYTDWKGRSKAVFADNMIFCAENKQ